MRVCRLLLLVCVQTKTPKRITLNLIGRNNIKNMCFWGPVLFLLKNMRASKDKFWPSKEEFDSQKVHAYTKLIYSLLLCGDLVKRTEEYIEARLKLDVAKQLYSDNIIERLFQLLQRRSSSDIAPASDVIKNSSEFIEELVSLTLSALVVGAHILYKIYDNPELLMRFGVILSTFVAIDYLSKFKQQIVFNSAHLIEEAHLQLDERRVDVEAAKINKVFQKDFYRNKALIFNNFLIEMLSNLTPLLFLFEIKSDLNKWFEDVALTAQIKDTFCKLYGLRVKLDSIKKGLVILNSEPTRKSFTKRVKNRCP